MDFGCLASLQNQVSVTGYYCIMRLCTQNDMGLLTRTSLKISLDLIRIRWVFQMPLQELAQISHTSTNMNMGLIVRQKNAVQNFTFVNQT